MTIHNFTDFSGLVDMMLDVVCVVDGEGHFVFVSAACENVFGYRREELLGRRMLDFVHPEDREHTEAVARSVVSGRPLPHFENRYVRRNGEVAHIMWTARWSEEGGMRVGVARDITGRKRAESIRSALYAISEAAHTASNLQLLFRDIHRIISGLLPANNFFVTLYDADSNVLSFPYHVDEYDDPPAARSLDTGTLSGEVIRSGQPLLVTQETKNRLPPHLSTPIGRDSIDWLGVPLDTGKGVIGALVVQTYGGSVRYSLRDQELLQFVSNQVATAIERKQLQDRLEYLALHDLLTGLPNRQLFHDRLGSALARAQRNESGFSLLFLDMDEFKSVNDRFGHACGDLLLKAVAQRLQQSVRASDTVARMGGDEFVVLLESLADLSIASQLVDKLKRAFDAPFTLEEQALVVRPSIGLALYPLHGTDARQLLGHADREMYAAKQQTAMDADGDVNS